MLLPRWCGLVLEILHEIDAVDGARMIDDVAPAAVVAAPHQPRSIGAHGRHPAPGRRNTSSCRPPVVPRTYPTVTPSTSSPTAPSNATTAIPSLNHPTSAPPTPHPAPP